jgi:hypothetical protein
VNNDEIVRLFRETSADAEPSAERSDPVREVPGNGQVGQAAASERRASDVASVPFSGAALLDELTTFLARYVVMSEAQATASALWIVHTHAFAAADASPYLAVTSPEKRSGKSRLFEVLELLVANPWKVITPTEAVVFRKIAADQPTLLLDETDAIFGNRAENHEGLRALLNAGNRRGTFVPRCVGTSQTLVSFTVFCPKAIAGIGELPDTIADRAIPIRLKRKARSEHAERFRRRDAEAEAERLYMDASAWAEHAVPRLTDARPHLPDELDDRAQDAWEPLLAIADLAGDEWPERARAAALELANGPGGEEESAGVLLLSDTRRVFDEQGAERLSSAALVAALHEVEESPWAEWFGKPITQTAIAKLLKRYGIQPKKLRFGEETARGYERAWFEEAWERYLPPDTGSNRNRRNIGSTKPLNQADVPDVPLEGLNTGDM